MISCTLKFPLDVFCFCFIDLFPLMTVDSLIDGQMIIRSIIYWNDIHTQTKIPSNWGHSISLLYTIYIVNLVIIIMTLLITSNCICGGGGRGHKIGWELKWQATLWLKHQKIWVEWVEWPREYWKTLDATVHTHAGFCTVVQKF